jgi:hypothetical protein
MIVALPGRLYETGSAEFGLCPFVVRHQCRACPISWLRRKFERRGNLDATGNGRRAELGSSNGVWRNLSSDNTTVTKLSGLFSSTADPGATGLPKPEFLRSTFGTAGSRSPKPELLAACSSVDPIASRLSRPDFVPASRDPQSSRKRLRLTATGF